MGTRADRPNLAAYFPTTRIESWQYINANATQWYMLDVKSVTLSSLKCKQASISTLKINLNHLIYIDYINLNAN